MKIPVVAISDNKLAFALATLFVNLMEVKDKETFYELNAVVSPDFSEDNIVKLKSIERQYKDCSVRVVVMDHRFDNIKNQTGYIANACAYKMCLSEIFPEYHKVLYLDTDLLIFRDLCELYKTDMGENYIAGVFSLDHYLQRRELKELLQIPDLLTYVNAGMLLVNLDLMRRDGIEAKLCKLIGSYKDSVDQHIFNKVCYGRIAVLELQWNVCQTSEKLYASDFGLVELTDEKRHKALASPYIFHYTGRLKPWNFYDIKYAVIWLRYYKKSPYSGVELDLRPTKTFATIPYQKILKRYRWNKFLYYVTFAKKFKERMLRYQSMIK